MLLLHRTTTTTNKYYYYYATELSSQRTTHDTTLLLIPQYPLSSVSISYQIPHRSNCDSGTESNHTTRSASGAGDRAQLNEPFLQYLYYHEFSSISPPCLYRCSQLWMQHLLSEMGNEYKSCVVVVVMIKEV